MFSVCIMSLFLLISTEALHIIFSELDNLEI